MKFGLPISFGLHASFLVIGALVLSAPITPLAETRIIPVTIINVDETSNVRATRKAPEPDPEPEKPEPIAQIEPEPEPVQEAALTVPPEVKSEEAPDAKPEAEAEIETGVEAKPEPKKPLSLNEILALADKAKSQSETPTEQRMLTAERNKIEQAAVNQARIGRGDGLSTSYEDAIMRKVYRGWQIPAGAPNMESLIVTVEIMLARDGRIETASLSRDSEKRMRGDRFYTAAAESALRAVNEAAKFEFLPRDQYEDWQSVTLTFYPQDAPSVVPI